MMPSGMKPHPPTAFLAATSLTFLKPRLRKSLRPVAAYLARSGVTANQVTLASLVGSIGAGALLCTLGAHRGLFAILPVWLCARMAGAALDGTLAIEFGQKSRLGGVLNEVSDIVSDISLFLPLGFVPPFSIAGVVLVIAFFVASELAGIAADRSIILAIVATAIAIFGELPEIAFVIVPLVVAGSIATIWNRVRFARTKVA
jgi:CDP-diacylglycerol--glycerol-3-phosphate 3-phosphatidyltransferase